MMLSKVGSPNGDDGDGDVDSNNGQLLRDIEAISKALYLKNAPRKSLISRPPGRSKSVEKPRLSVSKSSLNPINVNASVSSKDKKSPSVWNWKNPLKALTHIGHQKFNICFFLHVHSVEGLPAGFNNWNLSVHWERKDKVLQTQPSRILNGIAEFDETLMHQCCIYGSRSGPHNSAKYEVKLFLIYASIVGEPDVDLGKHWMDLTRLLPVTLEELEGLKSTGKWTTSFRLAGKARGAILNVSFGFSLIKDNLTESRRNMNVSELVNLVDNQSSIARQVTSSRPTINSGMLRRVGSVPSDLNSRTHLSSQSVDVKLYDDVLPNLGLELSKSIKLLYQKLNEVTLQSSEELHDFSENKQLTKLKSGLESQSDKDIDADECYGLEFTVIEQGMETHKKDDLELGIGDIEIETIDVNEIFKDDDTELDGETKSLSANSISDDHVDVVAVDDYNHDESSGCIQGSCVEDLEWAFNNFMTSESAELDFSLVMSEFLEQENCTETNANYKADKVIKRSPSLDEFTDSVAADFLNMLGIDHSPFGSDSDLESPRGRLLREFEEEAASSSNFFIEYDAGIRQKEFDDADAAGFECGDFSGDFSFPVSFQAAEEEHQGASQLLRRRTKAMILEDLETEALMKEWGLNEEAFQSTPHHCSDGFGSPVELLPGEQVELPPLGDGLGPFLQTKDGGYVRSMNPSLFRNLKNVGSLIMQVSRPVVLPAELGSDIIEILQHLASVGIERLSKKTNKLMPLEDVDGNMLQQIAEDAALGAAVTVRQTLLCCELLFDQDTILDDEMELDYVTVEHLVPLAMDKMETMLIEGLKIQSGMSEEGAAPSSIDSLPVSKMLGLEGTKTDLGWFLSSEGNAETQAPNVEDSGISVDRLLDFSITLQEWLRLDAGVIDDKDEVSAHTVNILAAHHAKCFGFTTGANDWEKALGKKHGLLGNNLTVAFMVLLRDPLRNYEPVGASMLAIVQVERFFFHSKPKLCDTVLERSNEEEEYDEWLQEENANDNKSEDQCYLGFKISEAHLSGLNTEPGKTLHWGTKMQQQYGTRWLLASGMTRSSKHPYSKSSAIVVSRPQVRRNMQNNDVLWSISSQVNGKESKWMDLAGLVSHVRNPNVTFAK